MPLEVHKDDFEKEVIQSEKPVVVDFWGPQCVPCLALSPHVDNLEKLYGERVKITKIDATKNRRLCLERKVMSLPTFLFFNKGVEIHRLTGNVKAKDVEESIQTIMKEAEKDT